MNDIEKKSAFIFILQQKINPQEILRSRNIHCILPELTNEENVTVFTAIPKIMFNWVILQERGPQKSYCHPAYYQTRK